MLCNKNQDRILTHRTSEFLCSSGMEVGGRRQTIRWSCGGYRGRVKTVGREQ